MTRKRSSPKTQTPSPEETSTLTTTEPAPAGWPDSVPILIAADICRKTPVQVDRRDLGGWLEIVFPGSHNPCYDQAMTALEEVVRETAGPGVAVWEFCDDEQYTLKQLAEAWNETMRRLGYDL